MNPSAAFLRTKSSPRLSSLNSSKRSIYGGLFTATYHSIPTSARSPYSQARPSRQRHSAQYALSDLSWCRTCRRGLKTSPRVQSNSKFSFRVAAAYSGKDRPYHPDKNLFNYNPFNRIQSTSFDGTGGKRKKKNRPDSGQDAFFISRVGDTEGVAFGVADGVGGWTNAGIDPAEFSHAFCDYMASTAYNHKGAQGLKKLKALDLMDEGYQKTIHDKSIFGGGSTACVAVASPDGNLDVANLGDSGFIQLRLNAVHYASPPQTHAFNTPYQLSMIPPKLLAQLKLFGGSRFHDLPKDSDVTQHKIRHGDVLIFASDGVWDNVTPQDILRTVTRYMAALEAWKTGDNGTEVGADFSRLTLPGGIGKQQENNLQALIATVVTHYAKVASLNTKVDGPFAREVKIHFPHEEYHGGKIDDICVIVAIAVEEGK